MKKEQTSIIVQMADVAAVHSTSRDKIMEK
jgi:hypothetical protein